MKKTLFTLIKSMLRGEKRAFNLTNQKYLKSKAPATLVLYKILEAEKVENVSKVEAKFSANQELQRLPVTVNQLFVQLLQSLREQAGKNRGDFAISRYLDNAKILFNRGLFDEALNQNRKAKKLALEMDYIEMVPAILSQENSLQQRLLKASLYYGFKKNFHIEYAKTLEKLHNIMDYIKLTDQVYELYRKKGVAKDDEDRKQYSFFLVAPLLEDESVALSLKAKIRFHIIQNLLSVVLHDLEKANYHINRLLELYETNRNYLRYNLDGYLSVMNNSLYTWSAKKEYDKFFEGIKKIRNLVVDFPDLEIYYQQRIFESTYSLELEYFIVNKNIKRGEEIAKEIEIGLKGFPASGITIDRILGFSIGIAFLFFKAEKYEEALDWVNKILKYERKTISLYFIGYAKIMHLMIHLSEKNYNYIINIEPTLRKWLKRKKLLSDIRLELLFFAKKYSGLNSRAEKKNCINTFLLKLESIPKDHVLISHYDIESWLKGLE